VLAGANRYTGGTIVQEGTLQGTTTSITGNVVNDAVVVFHQAASGTYAGLMSGSGALVKAGDGTVVLAGANTYSGGTLVAEGALLGDARTLQGTIVNNAALVFDQDTDAAFTGTLSGSGVVTKHGLGTLRLTGAHGLQGLMLVDSGRLALDGSLAGSVRIADGATLQAGGAIGGSLDVQGVLAANSAAGGGLRSLFVAGDLRFTDGARYQVSLDAGSDYPGLVVGGRATLGAASIQIGAQADGLGRVTHYPLVHAEGGLAGAAVATVGVPTLEPWLSQSDTTLFVTLLRTDIPLRTFATTVNGMAVGGAFDRVRARATGDLALVTRELTALDDSALAGALDALSGEIYASSLHLAALESGAVSDLVRQELAPRRSREGREGSGGGRARSAESRWWARSYAEWTQMDAASTHGGNARLQGVVAGRTWAFSERWLVGAGGAFGSARLTLDGLAESSDFTAPRGFAYAGNLTGRWLSHFGGSIARPTYETRRAYGFAAPTPLGDGLLFSGVSKTPTATTRGLSTDVWFEERLALTLGSWEIQPFVGLLYARYSRAGWSELDADGLALRAPDQTFQSTQGEGGVWVARATGRFRPQAAASYRRELGARRTTATLELWPMGEGSFVVTGLPLPRESLAGRAGFSLGLGRIDLSLAYQAQRARGRMRQSMQFALVFP
jgi:fibronectin-binding autotransporter adhesin